jgi:hypothetical protein
MSKKEKNEDQLSVVAMLGLPKAKRSQGIRDLTRQLKGTNIRDTVKVFGTDYTLETIEADAETWATNHIAGSTPLQIGRNQMAPYVAASLRAIDGRSIEEEFAIPEDELTDDAKKLLENKTIYHEWLRTQVLEWLLEDGNQDLVQDLWRFYAGLRERQREALESLDPLWKRTPTGESAPSSSPEKESSPPTQASNG